jgi:hypothetical protein
MVVAHGIFGILIIDHRHDVGLAPFGCWPVRMRAAMVVRALDVWTGQERWDDCQVLFAAMSPCGQGMAWKTSVMAKVETPKV